MCLSNGVGSVGRQNVVGPIRRRHAGQYLKAVHPGAGGVCANEPETAPATNSQATLRGQEAPDTGAHLGNEGLGVCPIVEISGAQFGEKQIPVSVGNQKIADRGNPAMLAVDDDRVELGRQQDPIAVVEQGPDRTPE